ncbi:DUF4350 domain-containing protein [uncultured Desulfuromonas sp.]|uniref:DUF4350 domain-containing protein n=1 Tax=uncultured Desulfuromonas sp. TaxID=181013 RepID=UPI00260AEFB6|nr:DUF4350 domain-containing protein [uncultured Desulfuromonas sp.]
MGWTKGVIFWALILGSVFCGQGAWGREGATVLFDQGHGQPFRVEQSGPLQLSNLADLFREEGVRVATTSESLSGPFLSKADALVISGSFVPLSPPEVEAVAAFVERGGRLCVMLHIGPPLNTLLDRLGVAASNGVIRERENLIGGEALNFRVTRLESHGLSAGLEEFHLYGAWALTNLGDNASVLARTGPEAWVDLNRDEQFGGRDAVQSFGVAVAGELGKGAFVVFGDDALFQNRFLGKENRALGRNLARWLAEGRGGAGSGP